MVHLLRFVERVLRRLQPTAEKIVTCVGKRWLDVAGFFDR